MGGSELSQQLHCPTLQENGGSSTNDQKNLARKQSYLKYLGTNPQIPRVGQNRHEKDFTKAAMSESIKDLSLWLDIFTGISFCTAEQWRFQLTSPHHSGGPTFEDHPCLSPASSQHVAWKLQVMVPSVSPSALVAHAGCVLDLWLWLGPVLAQWLLMRALGEHISKPVIALRIYEERKTCSWSLS